jgi:hypothetical protein
MEIEKASQSAPSPSRVIEKHMVLDGFVPEMEPDAQLSGTYWQQSSGWGQRRLTILHLVNITPCLPLLCLTSSIIFCRFFFFLAIHHYKIFGHREITKEEIVSRGPPAAKRGRREDDNDESRRRRKLEKGKEPATKDADKEPFFDDTKFVVDLLKSAFRKLEDVGAAFNIKAHHEVDKDPSMKGITFRIHRSAERLEKLPVVK